MTIQTEPQYKLRMPHELRDKIKASAENKNRSMNADIVARLEQSFLKDFHSANTAFPLLLAALVDYLPQDGRYNEEETGKIVLELLKYMTDPKFLKSYFQSINDYDETKGLNPLADD